jgi:hypothetical protein
MSLMNSMQFVKIKEEHLFSNNNKKSMPFSLDVNKARFTRPTTGRSLPYAAHTLMDGCCDVSFLRAKTARAVETETEREKR